MGVCPVLVHPGFVLAARVSQNKTVECILVLGQRAVRVWGTEGLMCDLALGYCHACSVEGTDIQSLGANRSVVSAVAFSLLLVVNIVHRLNLSERLQRTTP